MPEPPTPPLPPPPKDAVRLWVVWQAAKERTIELKRTMLPAGESVVGGVAMRLWDERVVQAMRDEVEAAYLFHGHPWWYGAFNGAEADRAIAEAAARLAEGVQSGATLTHVNHEILGTTSAPRTQGRVPLFRAVPHMRFRTVRPHEDRPLHPGSQTGSVLIAFHARPDTDVDAVMAEVEELVRALLADWYARRGHELLEAIPDVA